MKISESLLLRWIAYNEFESVTRDCSPKVMQHNTHYVFLFEVLFLYGHINLTIIFFLNCTNKTEVNYTEDIFLEKNC